VGVHDVVQAGAVLLPGCSAHPLTQVVKEFGRQSSCWPLQGAFEHAQKAHGTPFAPPKR